MVATNRKHTYARWYRLYKSVFEMTDWLPVAPRLSGAESIFLRIEVLTRQPTTRRTNTSMKKAKCSHLLTKQGIRLLLECRVLDFSQHDDVSEQTLENFYLLRQTSRCGVAVAVKIPGCNVAGLHRDGGYWPAALTQGSEKPNDW